MWIFHFSFCQFLLLSKWLCYSWFLQLSESEIIAGSYQISIENYFAFVLSKTTKEKKIALYNWTFSFFQSSVGYFQLNCNNSGSNSTKCLWDLRVPFKCPTNYIKKNPIKSSAKICYVFIYFKTVRTYSPSKYTWKYGTQKKCQWNSGLWNTLFYNTPCFITLLQVCLSNILILHL